MQWHFTPTQSQLQLLFVLRRFAHRTQKSSNIHLKNFALRWKKQRTRVPAPQLGWPVGRRPRQR